MNKHTEKQQLYTYWASIIAGTLLGTVLLVFYIKELFKPNGWLIEIYKEHFLAGIGLPFVAVLSLIIVIIFRNQEENIKVSMVGFSFEGASSQIIMWVIVFWAQVSALKLLW